MAALHPWAPYFNQTHLVKDMKKDEIEVWDLHRIFFGQAPEIFLLEVFIRTVLIYIVLIIVLRLLGKRMDGQLTLTEFSVMVMLGAIVSVPAQMPERGFLMGVVALLCVLLYQQFINILSVISERVERVAQGSMTTLVKDGKIQLHEMMKTHLSKQHLFSELRKRKIYNLATVKRVYFEACGIMSVYKEDSKRPGLPLFPSDQLEYIKSQTQVDDRHKACCNCGHVQEIASAEMHCDNCQENQWIEAII